MVAETTSTDWSTAYSQFLARSAATSARSMGLYQLALEHVSHGKLPPTIFQDHFPVFTATHAAEFGKQLSEVGARFLSELVRLGAAFGRQASETDGGSEGGPIVPPEFDVSNPARWYEQLAEYAGQLNARAVKMYRVQLDRVASGDATPSEAQQQAADHMTKQLPRYMELMTKLYFDLLNGLNDVRARYEETYFRGVLAATKPDGDNRPVVVTLSGRLGSTALASLSVTNVTANRSRIAHWVGDVRRVDGEGPSRVPAVVVAPETLELGPNEEATLTISLHLDPEQYDSDTLYSGSFRLTGGSDNPLALELRILATAPESHPSRQQEKV